MVKGKGKKKQGRNQGKGSKRSRARQRASRIVASTPYGECGERLSGFGGVLGLVKFLDLMGYKERFEEGFEAPDRESKLGHYPMVLGLLLLLFTGFQRVGHFAYIRSDTMLSGVLRVKVLPVVSTCWRYLQWLGAKSSESLLRLSGKLRERAWELCGYRPKKLRVDIDTTVATVYGNIEKPTRGTTRNIEAKEGCVRCCALSMRPVNIYVGASGQVRR